MRAIDGKIIFQDVDDHYRGIFSIYEFNDSKPAVIRERRRVREQVKKLLRNNKNNLMPIVDTRDKLVEVLAFNFMPNHIHLLLRQIKDDGIKKFIVKVGSGYGRYFNLKYSRKGYVFQDRFLAVRIKTDEQLKIVFAYIHTNSVSLIEPKWKERGIRDIKKVMQFVQEYKWSSFSDYLGKPNFSSVTDRKFILEIFGSEMACERFVDDYVKYRGRFKESSALSLE